jgi:hypothetical protein
MDTIRSTKNIVSERMCFLSRNKMHNGLCSRRAH